MRRLALILLPLFALALMTPPVRADEPKVDGKTLSEWITMLREDEIGKFRKAAAVSVAKLAADNPGDTKLVKDATVALGKAMRNDSSAGVRTAAATGLGRLAGDLMRDSKADVTSVVQDLADGIRSEKESAVRYEQAVALKRFGEQAKGAATALGAAAADKDPKVQAAVAEALGMIGKEGKAATDDLLPLVKSDNAEVRKWAVFALGRIDPADKVKVSEAIAKFTTDPDDQTKKDAITSLGLLADKSPDTVKAVAAALADKSVEVRRLAAAALSKFERGAKEVQTELLAAFKKDGEDKLVKAYALHSLCVAVRNDDPAPIIPELTARLDSTVEKDVDVRIAICDELGDMGPDAQSAVPKLREAEKDPEKKVRDAASFAIKKVIGKKEDKKEDKKDEKKEEKKEEKK